MNKLLLSVIISVTCIFVMSSQTLKAMPKSTDSLIQLKEALEVINIKDQTLRLMLPEVEKKFGFDSQEYRYYWSLIQQQDSTNLSQVTDILDKHGWVGKSKIGYKANQTLWLVIQHAPLDIQETYLPLLIKSVEDGESDGWYLAFLEDRILLRKGKKQKYGTQAQRNEKTGNYYLHDIEDPDTVNSRRQKIGLETIETYADKNGYLLKKD